MRLISNQELKYVAGGGDGRTEEENGSFIEESENGSYQPPAPIVGAAVVVGAGGLFSAVGYIYTTDRPTMQGAMYAFATGALGTAIGLLGGGSIVATVVGGAFATAGGIGASRVLSVPVNKD